MIFANSYGYRVPIAIASPTQDPLLITAMEIVFIHTGTNARVVKELSSTGDRDPTTGQWSWQKLLNDLPQGLYTVQAYDITPGRRIASDYSMLLVGVGL